MAKIIMVLLVEPFEEPRLVAVEDTLDNLHNLVEGYLQAIYPWDDPVALVCDENAIRNGKMPNRVLEDKNGRVYDVIWGTFFICGLGKHDFASINDRLAEKYTEKFRWPEIIMKTNGHLVMLREDLGARVIV